MTLVRVKAALKHHIDGPTTAASAVLMLYELLCFGRNYYDSTQQNDVPCDCEVYKKQTWHLYIQLSGPNFVLLLHVI